MKKIIYTLWGAILSLCITSSALAAGNINDAKNNLGKVGSQLGGVESDVENIVGTAINAALTLIGLIFLILMVYAGFLWMTAQGKEDQVEKAGKIIRSTIVGLVLVLSAYAITFFVTSKLGQ